jgi:hypothetical protein
MALWSFYRYDDSQKLVAKIGMLSVRFFANSFGVPYNAEC